MILFPAVDILDGRCVRLLYGDRNRVTDYGDPLRNALKWQGQGAEYLHLVDLNGAFDYSDANADIIKEIARTVKIKTQTGGGVRSIKDVESRLNAGITRVILGTAAYQNPQFVKESAKEFSGRVVCGIDCKDGFVAVKGWVEKTEKTGIEFALMLKDLGIDTVIFTDISRDGALTGVNAAACKEMQDKTGLNVVASGGVSGYNDIAALKAARIYGAILGRALYTKSIELPEALKI